MQFRQGDVYVESVDKIDADAEPVKALEADISAKGEAGRALFARIAELEAARDADIARLRTALGEQVQLTAAAEGDLSTIWGLCGHVDGEQDVESVRRVVASLHQALARVRELTAVVAQLAGEPCRSDHDPGAPCWTCRARALVRDPK